MVVQRAVGDPDVGDHALVLVVMAVEDQRLQRGGGVAGRRRDAADDRLQDLVHAGPLLGRRQDHLLARDGQRILQLGHHHLRIGAGQVDLVDDRDDHQVLADGQVDVGQRLRLDPLAGVDDQDRTLAGLQGSAHLVGEVDMPGRVDQVQAVGLPVLCLVLQAAQRGP